MKHPFLLLLFISLMGCKSLVLPMQTGHDESFRSLEKYIEQSSTINSYLFGMQLYDIDENQIVYSKNDNSFFTPASVNKWFTLYVATNYLEDSIAWMNVYDVDDQVVYQPLGDPSYMHPKLETDKRILNFFAEQHQDTINWNQVHFQDDRFGAGWAWDDYVYRFQTEKSAFPIHSNLIAVEGTEQYPSFIESITYYSYSGDYPTRLWDENKYYLERQDKPRYYPFRADTSVIKSYLVEQLKVFRQNTVDLNESNKVRTVYSEPSDSVYQLLMQDSDNHIAEQLLLQVSQNILGYMNTEAVISELQNEKILSNEHLIWSDASGLSRYNMTKPSTVVNVINQIVDQRGIAYLKNILPEGGHSGTIKNNYNFMPSRVFAKTGTLRHNHNLAGLVQAKSGKWYSFSIMNNHLPGSSQIAKKEMENILKLIVEFY